MGPGALRMRCPTGGEMLTSSSAIARRLTPLCARAATTVVSMCGGCGVLGWGRKRASAQTRYGQTERQTERQTEPRAGDRDNINRLRERPRRRKAERRNGPVGAFERRVVVPDAETTEAD
eukprot:2500074-Rhodomonas_salina.2